MTEEQINIECAKLDGWKCHPTGPTGRDLKFNHSDGRCVRSWKDLLRYTTSYDAIMPLIQKQDKETKYEFYEHFRKLVGSYNYSIDATPLQLATALIKAKGLWKN